MKRLENTRRPLDTASDYRGAFAVVLKVYGAFSLPHANE